MLAISSESTDGGVALFVTLAALAVVARVAAANVRPRTAKLSRVRFRVVMSLSFT
jgi:hypothetical protein